MGGNNSKHGHHGHHHKAESGGADQSTAAANKEASKDSQPEAPVAAAAAGPPPPESVDVMVLSTNLEKDMGLAKMIKEQLEQSSVPVYIHSEEGEAKVAGKLIVDAKCIIYIASEGAAMNNVGQDLISLAYISNKAISVVAEKPKKELLTSFGVGMRMTLYSINWHLFEDTQKQIPDYITEVQEMVASHTQGGEEEPTASITSRPTLKKAGRLNTKLRAQTTVQDFGMGSNQKIGSFWERHFQEDSEVPWYKFQKAFLDDYEKKLTELLGEENMPWLLDMLKDDIFEGADNITKASFMLIRGDSEDANAFWSVVRQVAVEKFNMKEVFNMNSSVRLAAIEKLAAFQNPAVIEALMQLLEDHDPNVRAVAAICLGRTGCSHENVIDKLIGLLKDGDRIVRQSACLSLGTMKAVKAIPHIGDRWRNDFISVVRNAARTALENMNIPEANEVLSVTKVLEDEIAALAGNQAAV